MESVDKTAFRLVVMTTSDSRTLQKNDSVGSYVVETSFVSNVC